MFNFSGSEIVFLLLLALIILGPEKLPEAVRKFGKTYAEFKKVTTGFQTELKSALDEPMREMRETAEAFKKAASFDLNADFDPEPLDADQAKTEHTGQDHPMNQTGNQASEAAPADPGPAATPAAAWPQTGFEAVVVQNTPVQQPQVRPAGLDFTSANPRPAATEPTTEPATAEPATAEPATAEPAASEAADDRPAAASASNGSAPPLAADHGSGSREAEPA